MEGVLVAGEVAGHLQSTAEEPLSNVLNPQILRWEPVMSWHINQGDTLPYPPCDSERIEIIKYKKYDQIIGRHIRLCIQELNLNGQ